MPVTSSTTTPPPAFQRLRDDLEIRTGFPPDVLAEAERVAASRGAADDATHPDGTDILFVTIDPPGSRDLDQAVQAERAGDGYRLRYAIADVGHWVDRGSAIEREAWLRGVTFYAPDQRAPLYPPALSHGAASLLPGVERPAIVFDLLLDADGELASSTIARARVRSRAQLTYTQLRDHVLTPAGSPLRDEPWAGTLTLVGEIGRRRLALEVARGGVSLPVRDQHVQAAAAATLGYEVVYEEPNEAERWNAEISLLTGHVAAERMLGAGVGLLRTMPSFMPGDLARFRRIARGLGFSWPDPVSYAEFMHALDPEHPHIDTLVRQARRVMRGAEYVAFDGAPPEQPLHGALAFTYAHATAPLRRLADRYVLDLLVTLEAGRRPTADEVATLGELPTVMQQATRRENALERKVVDLAEAWMLHDRIGETFRAIVVDVQRGDVEVQLADPPIRTTLSMPSGGAAGGTATAIPLGGPMNVRLQSVDTETGTVELTPAD